MPVILRVELIVFSVLFVIYVIRAINKKKLLLKYSLIWLIISAALILISFFPAIITGSAALFGIETPSNFVYLLAIIVLLIFCFSFTVILSKQNEQNKTLIQKISIEKYLSEQRKTDDMVI